MGKDKIKFSTELLQAKKTATGIEIPEAVIQQLGNSKKPPVKVTINGYTYRSTVAVMGGKYMVGVSADVREKANVAGGDMITVELQLDTEAREVAVPADLAAALAKAPEAKKAFEALSYSRKQFFVLPIDQAKGEDTRKNRIAKTIAQFTEGK